MIMETEKLSHKIWSWQSEVSKELVFTLQCISTGLRAARMSIMITAILSRNLKTEEEQYPSSKTIRKREQILPYFAFYSIQAFKELDEAIYFTWYTNSNINFTPKHLTYIPKKIFN